MELLHTAQHEAQGLLTLWADSQKQLRRLTTVTQAAITAFWKLDYAAVLNHFEQAVCDPPLDQACTSMHKHEHCKFSLAIAAVLIGAL